MTENNDDRTYHVKTDYIDDDMRVHLSGYQKDDSLAVMLEYADDGEIEHVSVNLSAYYSIIPKPGMGQFYVKDDSEHAGLPAALELAGIAVGLQQVHYGPFRTKARLMQLTIDNPIGL